MRSLGLVRSCYSPRVCYFTNSNSRTNATSVLTYHLFKLA